MPRNKKEPELTPEQRRENDLKSFSDRKIEFMPKPTYFYKVGDRVSIGALQDVYVCNIISDSVYEIDFTSIDNNYGNPIRNEHLRRFVSWYDIRPYNTDISEELIKNQDLRLSYSQRSMEDIFSKAYHFGINFDPEYQRDYVWDLEDKVALVDSVFNNIDIGKFVFIHNGYGERCIYTVLDGKQRTRAILDFYENKFAYKGKYFNDLSLREQGHFENYPISIAEVRNVTEEQILRYFIMVNRCGRVMAKEQIDKVEKMLEELEQNKK